MKVTTKSVENLNETIGNLLERNMPKILESWRNSSSDKYSFTINVAMTEGHRDDEHVGIITPTISFSEKHKDSEEVVVHDEDQLRMD